MEKTLKPKTIGAFVRLVSGMFITKENPLGLTPSECTVLAAIVHVLSQKDHKVVTREDKEELANMSNHSVQVITNYVNKLKRKGALQEDGSVHPILSCNKLVIEYGEGNV